MINQNQLGLSKRLMQRMKWKSLTQQVNLFSPY